MIGFCIQNTIDGLYLALDNAAFAGWTEIDKAFHFTKKEGAQNYISNNIAHVTSGVVSPENCIVVTHDNSMIESGLTQEQAVELTEGLSERMRQMYETGEVISSLIKFHLSQMQTADLAISDLLHKIEFSDANVVGGYRMYKTMQELRRRRRTHKDMYQLLSVIQQTGLLNKLKELETRLPKCEIGLDSRQYTPRVSVSLFEAESNKELSDALDRLLESVSVVGIEDRIA